MFDKLQNNLDKMCLELNLTIGINNSKNYFEVILAKLNFLIRNIENISSNEMKIYLKNLQNNIEELQLKCLQNEEKEGSAL